MHIIIYKQVVKKQCNGWHVLMPCKGTSSQHHMLYIFIRLPFLLHSLTNMGNCIVLPCSQSPSKKVRGLGKATRAATTVDPATENGNDPLLHAFTLPTKVSPQIGEVQNVVPCLKELENLLVSSKITYSDGGGARKVKIVVTKEQFKLLLANAKKFQCRQRLLSYTGPRRGCKKWRPSLSVISEEQDF